MTKKEPREFWIVHTTKPVETMRPAGTYKEFVESYNYKTNEPAIRLIEYSAYENLKQIIKDYEEALKAIDNRAFVHSNPDSAVLIAREVLKKHRGDE